MTLMNQYLPLT
jgi:hypothetical protein